jgi:hypothetical protein
MGNRLLHGSIDGDETLGASESNFRALIETMPQLVWSTRPDGYADYFNPAWYRYTGAADGETDGDAWADVLHPDDRGRARSTWETCVQTGEPYEIRYRLRHGASGRYRWFLGRANPLRNERGEIVRWMGTCTDIDGERSAIEQLARANRDLEHFAYAASHDLVEPLRTILLYSQLIEQRQAAHLDEAGREALDAISGGASRMMALLRDLAVLLRSGQAAGKPRKAVDLNEVVTQVLDDLRAAREEAQAAVAVDPLPTLRVEPSHFAQIVQNLVSNALRYRGGRPARIHIGVDPSGPHPAFFVEDNGEGIAEQYRERIFDAFTRLHGPRVAGSGLGLTICARLVESYGGRIWVESSPGRGSRFLFTLPEAVL